MLFYCRNSHERRPNRSKEGSRTSRPCQKELEEYFGRIATFKYTQRITFKRYDILYMYIKL